MKLAIAILASAVSAAPSPKPQRAPLDEPVNVQMTPAQVAQCEAEGGCHLFTRAYIENLVEQVKKQACRTSKEI